MKLFFVKTIVSIYVTIVFLFYLANATHMNWSLNLGEKFHMDF